MANSNHLLRRGCVLRWPISWSRDLFKRKLLSTGGGPRHDEKECGDPVLTAAAATVGDNACDHKDRGAPLPNFGVVYLHCCLLGAAVLGEGY